MRAAGTYLGQKQTGSGRDIPIFQDGPRAGQLDINSLIGGMVDRRKMYFYDTLKLAPGTVLSNTPYQFFFNSIGQPDPYNGNTVKTLLETNMESQGMFTPPYDLIVFNLGFLVWGNLQDLETIFKMTFFDFSILGKRQFYGSMLRHPSGMGLSGFSTKNNEGVWNNGMPQPDAVWMFGDYKKYIPPMVKFSLTLNAPESYTSFYNTSANYPIDVKNQGITDGNLPTLLTQNQGGNGVIIVPILNGLSDGPVS